MSDVRENGPGTRPRIGSRARLILQVSLPRLGMHADEIEKVLEQPAPDGARALAESTRRFPGEEGLAVLSALPEPQRRQVLDEFDLPTPVKERLGRIAGLLGRPAGRDTPAAALVRMYPEAARLDSELEVDPTGAAEETPTQVSGDQPSVESLAATVAAWQNEDVAIDALDRLTAAVLPVGSPLPVVFWGRAAGQLLASSSPKRWELLLGVSQILVRQGEPRVAFEILAQVASHFDQVGEVEGRIAARAGMADVLLNRGEVDRAETVLQEAIQILGPAGAPRTRVAIAGRLGDVSQRRGDLDEALRIFREEQLPAYERLGDVRSRAMTLGKVADILAARGELDGALRTLQEEALPVFERLGACPRMGSP